MNIQDLKVTDILAISPRGFIGRGVAEFTQSSVSHVAMYTGEGFCFEENGFFAVGGVPVSRYLTVKGTQVLRLRGVTDEQVTGIMGYLATHYGEVYDYVEIADIYLKGEFGIDLHHHNPNKSICSSILGRAMKENGIDAFPNKDIDSVVPGDYLKSDTFSVIGIVC